MGAGRAGFLRWLPVYRKIQAAGKGIQVTCDFAEIDDICAALDPHGVYLSAVMSPHAGLRRRC